MRSCAVPMYLNETDWLLIVEINELLKQDSTQSRLQLYDEIERRVELSLKNQILFQKGALTEQEQYLLIESFARFSFLIGEKYGDAAFLASIFESTEDEIEEYDGDDDYGYDEENKCVSVKEDPNKPDDNLDPELQEISERPLYTTLRKIFEVAFENTFFPRNVPIVFFQKHGLTNLFEFTSFAVSATTENWNFESFYKICTDIVTLLKNLRLFYQDQSSISSTWNDLLVSLGGIENLEEKLSLMIFKDNKPMSPIKGVTSIISVLNESPIFFVCFPDDIDKEPLYVNKGEIHIMRPVDVMKKRQALDLLNILPIFIKRNLPVLTIEVVVSLLPDDSESSRLNENLSHSISGLKKFCKNNNLKGLSFDNISKKTDIGKYVIKNCKYPLLFIN